MVESRPRQEVASAAARWVARTDAGLEPGDRKEFEQWIAADPRHAAAFEHFSKSWSVLDRPSRAGTADSVLLEMAAQARRRQRRMATAVSLLAVLLAGYLWRSHSRSTAESVGRLSDNAIERVPERRALPDGSQIELRPGAQIAVNFTDAVRRVVLQKGEAHFHVAKNKARPFVVSAGGIEVRAVGTVFSVDLGNKEVDVFVAEGRVAVNDSRGTAVPEADGSVAEAAAASSTPDGRAFPFASVPTFVDAGQSLVVPLTRPPRAGDQTLVASRISSDELAQRLAWRTPQVEFSDTPLAAAVELMNRSSVGRPDAPKVRLVIDAASPGLSKEPVTGMFRADNSEGFVRVLELSLGVKAERSGDTIVLRRP